MPSRECVGVLLAGGAARRFGGVPKGLALVEGMRIADRVLAALDQTTTSQVVIANAPGADAWFPGRRVVGDSVAGLGPLSGLVTALRAAAGQPVLVVAWDMPFVSSALLRALRITSDESALCCVPLHGRDDTPEPLCALYAAAALPVAETLLARGERRARALYEALALAGRARTLSGAAMQALGDPARLFLSVDSAAALAALGGSAPAA